MWGVHIATNAEFAFILYKRTHVYWRRASPYYFLVLAVGFEVFVLTLHSSVVRPPPWCKREFKIMKKVSRSSTE